MSKRASPATIGGFVIGAVGLAVAGVIVLGSGRFFEKTYPFVAFFEGSVTGLSIGAPVKFKGVDIGSVTHIFIQIDPEAQTASIPVYFALDENKLVQAGVRGDLGSPEVIDHAVRAGLRAQLQTESLVTGVLFVQLNYHPGTPLTLVGSPDGTPEIPTLPTQIEQAQTAVKQILAKVDEINFKGLVDELTRAATSISDFATSPEIQAAIDSLNKTMVSIRELSSTVEKNVTPLTVSLRETSDRVGAVGRELEETLATARTLIEPEAPLAVDMRRALADVRDAARALQSLVDELDRNPSSLIFGREARPQEGDDQ